jgi:hypothetical protein
MARQRSVGYGGIYRLVVNIKYQPAKLCGCCIRGSCQLSLWNVLNSYKTRREILNNIRNQYQEADWLGKTKLLDGFVATSGYDRKYAIKLLNSKETINKPPQARQSKIKYDEQVKQALITVWYAAN